MEIRLSDHFLIEKVTFMALPMQRLDQINRNCFLDRLMRKQDSPFWSIFIIRENGLLLRIMRGGSVVKQSAF